jgi:hypothetical protein
MRKTIWAGLFAAAAAFTVGSEARADANLHSGDVLRPGDNMIYGELGWPDLVFGFQHGMSDKVDIGFRFSLIYGWEYTAGTAIGLGMRVPIRITPVRTGKISFQIRFEPGLKFDNFGETCDLAVRGTVCGDFFGVGDAGLHFGLWIPLGLDVGIHITREATLSFGMEAPIFINFTNGVYGAIPLLFGPGFEYDIDDHMAVGGNVKIGPTIIAACVGQDQFGNCINTSGATVGFITSAFFAYRL